MELVDVYGLFLIFFMFTNFVLFYYNFFFQIFFLSKDFMVNATTVPVSNNNTTKRLTPFTSTFALLQKSFSSTTSTFTKEILK